MTTVLIVEDNEKNLKLLRDLLRAKGYQTAEARTGGDALRVVHAAVPHLVLLDIQLPDINGIEVLKRMREKFVGKDVKVVAITASVMPDDQARIRAAGVDAYVTKPISVKPFLELIARLVGVPGQEP